MTALLEYHDLAMNTRSWVSLHNSLAFTQILLYYCKEFLWWLLQLHIDFQLITLNGCSITGSHGFFIQKFNRIIPVGFYVIPPWSFSEFFSNHKKALLLCLLHLHAKCQLIPWSSSQQINLVLREQLVITPEIFNGFALKLVRRFVLMCLFCVPSFSLILACVHIL